MSHYTEDELATYALRPEAVHDRAAFEAHLSACTDCRYLLDTIEAFDSALRDPLPWELADEAQVVREVPRNLLDAARNIAAEDEEARALITPLVQSSLRFREARIDEDPRFCSLGAIRMLCRVANGMHERQPQFGLLLANTALSIANKLPEELKSRAAWHVGTAWKERANALRYIGRLREAEESLDHAERAFEAEPHPEPFDLAIVWYVRSIIYQETDRFAEAAFLARAAAGQFKLYGDTPRFLAARMAEAATYYCEDRDADAAPIFESVAATAREATELSLLARALSNAATCYSRLAMHEKAAEYYVQALAAFDDLDLPTERARVQWALAALNVETGDYEKGIAELERARAQLLRSGLTNDAALASLDLVVGLMVSGESDRVPQICRSIAVTFASEGMTRNAKKALAYLNEAVGSGNATPDAVRHVRAYLTRLPMHPREEFLQLQ